MDEFERGYDEGKGAAFLVLTGKRPEAFGPYRTVKAADEDGWATDRDYVVVTSMFECGDLIRMDERRDLSSALLGKKQANSGPDFLWKNLNNSPNVRRRPQMATSKKTTAKKKVAKKKATSKKAASKKTTARKKAPAKKATSKKAAVKKAGTSPRNGASPPQGIGLYIRDLIKQGKDNGQVCDAVLKKFPTANTKPHNVSWYRTKMRQEGLSV